MALSWTDLTFALCATALVYRLVTRRRTPPPPPGPRRLPFIGNLLDMPSEKPWIKFAEWGDTYGDITSINVMGQQITILNSMNVAVELLDKRSAICSDRPRVTMAGELVGWNQNLGLTPYGGRFRRFRRMAHSVFGNRQLMMDFQSFEEAETHRFLKRVVSTPEDLQHHIDRFSGSIILRICYGYDVKEDGEDPFVSLGSTAMAQFSLASAPGGFVVNSVPALRHLPSWIPGTSFRALAKVYKGTLERMVQEPFDWVKKRMAAGTAEQSLLHYLLERKEEDEYEAKWLALSMYAGGSHTTVSSIYAFFKAMALHPEVMAKAQKEIDSVVGDGRLPGFSDKKDLPYTNALISEVHRWHTVVPTGLPHRVMEDDVYNGWFLPKGSIVLANIWKMTHDPRTYKNPMLFNPERFLASEGKDPELDPSELIFGFGRRICPGRVLAEASVWITIVMALAVFDISRHPDGEGIDVDVTTGTVSLPTRFKCSIKPRSAKAAQLIQAEVRA
ncbi:cytochrome P450 [Roridomyces roridus]|uniref:Cytochrome P450 n=1 Tax=Roridomyces roridus TaxID=1738132 RepID=A0AAD7B859_9AGAR|nr:cytochrome P450 [Roridomyces roridus]